MGKKREKPEKKGYQWILFFYTVPSKPVSNRMTVWRKLMKAGAVLVKGSVYILPFSPAHYEFLQWLVAGVKEIGGDAALVVIDEIDTMKDEEIVELFNQSRRNDYLPLARGIEENIRKFDTIRKGGQGVNVKSLARQLEKCRKSFAELQAIDFFVTSEGIALKNRMDQLHDEVLKWAGPSKKSADQKNLSQKSTARYRGRRWVTRKQPFVDRMASAWLIKRFIDPDASFAFVDAEDIASLPNGAVAFDMFEGEFTHSGEFCTFEVLIRTFGLKDKTLRQMAEIVHDLDIKDNRYQAPEAPGVEGILSGIRKSAKGDSDALARGMQVFEALYVSKKA